VASEFGLSARQLSWYNRDARSNKSGRLTPGQDLLIPSSAVVAGALDIPDPSIERYGTSAGRDRVTHVVRKGETLGSIAKKYHTSIASIASLNHLRKRVIYPGQTIIVKGASRSSSARRSKSTPSGSAKSSKSKSSKSRASSSRGSSGGKKTAASSKKATGSSKRR
jgi:LysM repeat protein